MFLEIIELWYIISSNTVLEDTNSLSRNCDAIMLIHYTTETKGSSLVPLDAMNQLVFKRNQLSKAFFKVSTASPESFQYCLPSAWHTACSFFSGKPVRRHYGTAALVKYIYMIPMRTGNEACSLLFFCILNVLWQAAQMCCNIPPIGIPKMYNIPNQENIRTGWALQKNCTKNIYADED